jgi:hypothetical protein
MLKAKYKKLTGAETAGKNRKVRAGRERGWGNEVLQVRRQLDSLTAWNRIRQLTRIRNSYIVKKG